MSVFEGLYFRHLPPNDGATTTYTLSAGTTDVNSVSVDIYGFGGSSIAFLIIFGANLDTGTCACTVQGSDDNTTFTTVTGATKTLTDASAASSNQAIGIEVREPQYRYYRVAFDRATANTSINALYALLPGPRAQPTTQVTTAGQFFAAPTIVNSP